MQPTTHQADSPTGLEFEAKLAQTEAFGTPATSPLKNLTVTFPQGMTVDPSSADGLGTCSEAQIGWLGPDRPNGEPLPNGGLTNFHPEKPEGAGGCPENSKIGTLELETPLIPGKLYGEVFLAAQNANPFDSIFATVHRRQRPGHGGRLKLAGEVKLCASAGELITANPSTGQITVDLRRNPAAAVQRSCRSISSVARARSSRHPRTAAPTRRTASSHRGRSPRLGSGPRRRSTTTSSTKTARSASTPPSPAARTNLQAGAYTTFQASFERQD